MNFKKIENVLNDKLLYSISFIAIIFTQFPFLNIEISNWDISTFLIGGQDIGRGNFPYESQIDTKGPILYFIYYFLIQISNSNLVFIKILNDIPIFLISIVLIKTLSHINNSQTSKFITILFFIIGCSVKGLARSGFSELYALIFISLGFYFLLKDNKTIDILLSGILVGISSLVAFGTIMFLISFLIYFIINKKAFKFYVYLTGFSIPHLIFIIIYFLRGTIDRYLLGVYHLPRAWASTGNFYPDYGHYFNELKNENIFFAYAILFVPLFLFDNKIINFKIIFFILASILFFYGPGSGHMHHLTFIIYSASLSLGLIKYNNVNKILFFTLFIAISFTAFKYSTNLLSNFSDFSNLKNNYKVNALSDELIEKNYNKLSLLALDDHLILFYLNKPQFVEIIHPGNLIHEGTKKVLNERLKYDYDLDEIILKKPEIIICNTSLYSCDIDGYTNIELKNSTNVLKLND